MGELRASGTPFYGRLAVNTKIPRCEVEQFHRDLV
jgi:hypothetical protein